MTLYRDFIFLTDPSLSADLTDEMLQSALSQIKSSKGYVPRYENSILAENAMELSMSYNAASQGYTYGQLYGFLHGISILQAAQGVSTFVTGMNDIVSRYKAANRAASVGSVESGTYYGPMNKGPLPDNVADTFRSSSYTQKVSTGEYVYRVHGGTASETGSFYTRIPQNGGMQSQIDLALDPAWGNTATNVTKVFIPEGTVYFEGFAAPQSINGGSGALLGGGSQIYVPR